MHCYKKSTETIAMHGICQWLNIGECSTVVDVHRKLLIGGNNFSVYIKSNNKEITKTI